MDERALVDLAQAQHGLVTRSQARAAGASDSAISRRVAAGRWSRLRPGVYVVGAAPATWPQAVMAAVLAAGPGTVASHRTAARLWMLVDRSGPIEVLSVTTRRISLQGVTSHRTSDLPPADEDVRLGVPCTSLTRTLFDVAHRAGDQLVGRWVDLAVRDHGATVDAIAARASELAVPGRSVPRSLVAALALRCEGYDPGRSALESRVLDAIARAGLPSPERQWRFERAGGRTGFIDLAYPAARVAIELDGWAEHGLRSSFDADRARGNDLVLAGWRLLRFTWSMSDADICAAIAAALTDAN